MLSPLYRISREELRESFERHADTKTKVKELNLQLYVECRREGKPLPAFGRGSKFKCLFPADLDAIVVSQLSPEAYEAAHGVDALIVRDVRRWYVAK